jgi:hypothetical protein
MTALHLPAVIGVRPEGWLASIGLARVLSDRWPDLTVAWDRQWGHLILDDGPATVEDVATALRTVLDGIPEGAVLPGVDPGWPPKGARPGTDLTTTWEGPDAVEWQTALVGRLGDLHPLIAPHAAQTLTGMLAAMLRELRTHPELLTEALTGLGMTEAYGAGLWILRRDAGTPAASPGRDWLAVLGVPWTPLMPAGDGEAAVGWPRLDDRVPRLSWSLWVDPIPAVDLPERLQVADLDPRPQHVWARSRARRQDPPILRPVHRHQAPRGAADLDGELVPLMLTELQVAQIDAWAAGLDEQGPPVSRADVASALLQAGIREAIIADGAVEVIRRGPGRPSKYDEPLVGLRVRLPESLHAELVEAARAAGRSLNDEIIARCRATT